MHKVFTGILPCGILPALSQHISRASELGIFENQSCLRCLRYDVFESLLDLDDFEMLSQILPMFTGLSTILVESVLLGRVREPFWRYVIVFWTFGGD
jgi:hypothetical protein